MIGSERARGAIGPGSRLLERALSATQAGVMVTDATRPDDPIVWVNGAFERITGYAAEEVLGRNPRFLQAGDSDQPALDGLREARGARNDDVEWAGVVRNYRKDGTLFYNELVAAAVRDERGRATHHVGFITDVTEREEAEERLRFQAQLLDAVGQAVVAVDLSGRITHWNRAAEGLYGWPAAEAVGRPAHEVMVSEEQMERAGEVWGELVAGRNWSGEFVVRRRDGTTFPAMVTNSPVLDGRGGLAGIIGVSEDITERKEAEEALRESEQRFRALFEQSSDALLVHDGAGMMVDCNLEACRSLGYPREELLSLSVEDFGLKLVSDEEGLDRDGMLWERVMAAEPGTVAGAVLGMHRRKDGTTFPVEVRLSGVDYGGRRLILASCRDLTERRTLEGRLAHQAFHDPLTGLPNRALFVDRLEHALARAGRGRECVAVLFMDLDDFKDVNDSLGHEAGDELLVAVAERLRGCVRPGDTAARLGGDEFVVLLEGPAGAGEALRVAERVKEALGNPFALRGHGVFVTASIGAAFNGSGAKEDPGELLREADVAMYAAKRGGKDRLRAFEEAMDAPVLKRLEAQTDLRRALERGELALRYQPKVDLRSGKIACMEALAYWEHPERGLVPPTEFIPVAEETGLIVPLGRRVLREACREAKDWQALRPKEEPPLTVSVNLSARQFEHEGLAQDVARALEESGLAAAHLILEITEGVVMEDAPRTAGIMGELKALGVELSIDDFGTGYSSLSYLRRFPVDYLKIDRSFVEGLGENPGDEVVASGMLSLAHAMGLEVVAEGVETEGQLRMLKEMGCDMAQGYLFSEPLPPEAASELLAGEPPGP